MNNLYPKDPKTTWRGDTICTDMKAPLEELARISGSDIYVRPIPGFGSYQSGTTASGHIAIRGGHVDLDLTRLSQAQALRLETLARKSGWYADIRYPKWYSRGLRRWMYAKWQKHLHMTLIGDPHLSPEARGQQWQVIHNDADGMSATPDPDDGYRGAFFGRTFAQYRKRIAGIAPASVVKALQKAVGLKADGWWGPVTEAALQKVRAAKAPQATVVRIQTALDTVPDGHWGPVTEASYQALRAKTYRHAKALPPAKTPAHP